jgi:hypothetical protein
MRLLAILAILALASGTPVRAQTRRVRANPGLKCGDQSPGIPDSYERALLDHFEPPGWRSSQSRISVGQAEKLDLWTDGAQFKLWTDTFSPTDVDKFLDDLNQSCRLPADPIEAASLLKVKWESVDLSPARFGELYRSFTIALGQYVSGIKAIPSSTLEPKSRVVYVDASRFQIVFDNGYQHMEASVWDDPKQEPNTPMLKWIAELQKLADESFHRSSGAHSAN